MKNKKQNWFIKIIGKLFGGPSLPERGANRNGTPWTPMDDVHLIKRMAEGASYLIVSVELGRTHAATNQRASDLRRQGIVVPKMRTAFKAPTLTCKPAA
jgi:hypothetical protein